MNSDEIFKVIEKLIGAVEPVADAAIDSTREENLKVFLEVFDSMHTVVDDIAHRHKNSPYSSQKKLGVICDKHLDKMGVGNYSDEEYEAVLKQMGEFVETSFKLLVGISEEFTDEFLKSEREELKGLINKIQEA